MADAVVVGGGMLGLCAAAHLNELGVRDIVVVEREPDVATQTTAAGAGFVAHWGGAAGSDPVSYGMSFYAALQDEDGTDLGVLRVGLLLPALSAAGMAFLEERRAAWSTAPNMSIVRADEALELAPILAPGAVIGGLHQANAHQVPTVPVAAALRRRLARLGVQVRTGVETRRALIDGGRVVGVETSAGTISCGIVVNAAGASARALGRRNGIAIAAVPILESRFVTDPLPGLPDRLPMLLFFELDLLYLRGESGGLLVGAIERELFAGSRVSVDEPPRTSELSSHAVEGHERLARRAADIVPVLARAAVARRASGLPTFTPDGRHIAGAAPGVEGYFVLAGCNESGVTYGPALSRLVAELAVGSAPTLDPAVYRVDRFGDLSAEQLQAAAEARYLGRIPEFARRV